VAFLLYAGWTLMGLGLAGGICAVAAAWFVARVLSRAPGPAPDPLPAVTVLKPLHGDEPSLEDALASFLAQNYAAPVQIVFGLQDEADPARAVVARLKANFPNRDIAIVINPQRHGTNRKVSNLINMMGAAKHDVLVLADSDIHVPSDYLATVVAALARPGAGAVSCLYTGKGVAGAWSRFAAMAINYHFLPNAALGIASGLAHPCFGSTIALSRETLGAMGGFAAFADYLADDYEIGRAVRAAGKSIAYPPLTVTHGSTETGPGALMAHELRWARTIRVIDPVGHWGSIVTHAFALGLIGAALLGFTPLSCVVLAAILAARLFLKARIDHIVGESAGPFWLLPARDVLSFGLFAASLFGTAVEWRGARLRVDERGAMSHY
jgi:ceramide glucosyltransferase